MQSINRRVLTGMAGIAMAAVMLPGTALAADSKNQGYLLDSARNVVTSPTSKLCWRTIEWTPARAIAQCDPDLVKKPMKPKARPAPMPHRKPMAKPKPTKKKKARPMVVNAKLSVQNFDFDKATMRDDQREWIDKWLSQKSKAGMRRWKGVTLTAVVVTGHTDKFGSRAYNKKLSEERAKTVKDYLVSKGWSEKIIFWEGRGFDNPVPVTKFCDNKMSRKKLIDCLAPNRRVDIDAVGTKPRPAKKKKKK